MLFRNEKLSDLIPDPICISPANLDNPIEYTRSPMIVQASTKRIIYGNRGYAGRKLLGINHAEVMILDIDNNLATLLIRMDRKRHPHHEDT